MSDPASAEAGDAASSGAGESGAGAAPTLRQRVERLPGSRRAKLTPAPGTIAEPAADALLPGRDDDASVASSGPASSAARRNAAGPNDERLRRDVPPHY